MNQSAASVLARVRAAVRGQIPEPQIRVIDVSGGDERSVLAGSTWAFNVKLPFRLS